MVNDFSFGSPLVSLGVATMVAPAEVKVAMAIAAKRAAETRETKAPTRNPRKEFITAAAVTVASAALVGLAILQ
jgi:hypothetical protein